MKVIRDWCGFQEGCFVPSIGSNGGLALFWDSKVRIKILGSSLSHIEAELKSDDGSEKGCWTRLFKRDGMEGDHGMSVAEAGSKRKSNGVEAHDGEKERS